LLVCDVVVGDRLYILGTIVVVGQLDPQGLAINAARVVDFLLPLGDAAQDFGCDRRIFADR
jgi:hypothetical protein